MNYYQRRRGLQEAELRRDLWQCIHRYLGELRHGDMTVWPKDSARFVNVMRIDAEIDKAMTDPEWKTTAFWDAVELYAEYCRCEGEPVGFIGVRALKERMNALLDELRDLALGVVV